MIDPRRLALYVELGFAAVVISVLLVHLLTAVF